MPPEPTRPRRVASASSPLPPVAADDTSLPAADLGQQRRVPAWMMSAGLHTVLLVTIALMIQMAPRGGFEEPDRGVGVVLARSTSGKVDYFDEAAEQAQAAATQATSAAASTNPLPAAEEIAVDLGGVLPAAEEAGGVGDVGEFLPKAEDLTQGGGAGKSFGGQAQTQIYGITGQGTKFIYVFDRSGSMSGYGGRPLRSAKAELSASLGDLEQTHQFQIIFYNEEPQVFTPDGRTPRLVFGDEQGKTLARRFVQGIIATGGTEHMQPLLMALAMRPDVVFFLTDADEPKLDEEELARLRRTNHGTQIHAIEFGFGPSRGGDNFLKQLSRQNGGEHAYIDISKLPD